MKEVYTIKEAEEWFLRNHVGCVICVNNKGEKKEVECYPDAVLFFTI